jgi:hypothetical protein
MECTHGYILMDRCRVRLKGKRVEQDKWRYKLTKGRIRRNGNDRLTSDWDGIYKEG